MTINADTLTITATLSALNIGLIASLRADMKADRAEAVADRRGAPSARFAYALSLRH